jgi:hypothetical protein
MALHLLFSCSLHRMLCLLVRFSIECCCAVIEFRGEGGAQVFKIGAIQEDTVIINHDFLHVINS